MAYFVNINNLTFLQFDIFRNCDIVHFSSTIVNGASRNSYSSFNLGLYSGDEAENVLTNRNRLCAAFDIPTDGLFVPNQTHGDKILSVDATFLSRNNEKKERMLNGVDALITDQANIGIAIATADCVPVIIYDPYKRVIATIHAGWKGAVAKIAGKVVYRMIEDFDCKPEDLLAGIGPCISQERFEVGEEVLEIFSENGFSLNTIGQKNQLTGKVHLDLSLINKLTLMDSGVALQNIEEANLCTYNSPDLFFSARRQTIYSGRMLTGGMIK